MFSFPLTVPSISQNEHAISPVIFPVLPIITLPLTLIFPLIIPSILASLSELKSPVMVVPFFNWLVYPGSGIILIDFFIFFTFKPF